MRYRKLFFFALTLFVLFWSETATYAQTRYRIYLKDKPHFLIEDSACYLSPSALLRRSKQRIPVDPTDAPVYVPYLTELSRCGIMPLYASKWLNAVSVALDEKQLILCQNLPFVQKIEPVRYFQCQPSCYPEVSGVSYGESGNSIRQLEMDFLHQNGYWGAGIKIAVIDDGFFRLNVISAFNHLFKNGQILAVRDFTDQQDPTLFKSGAHGTNVISLMNAYAPDTLVGGAYQAQYFLCRTEVGAYERPTEEDNWIRAAEWADSAGAEIFQTSLNYNTFDDPNLNHKISQLDGKSIAMSRAATMAARKGILVVHSAGNEGRNPWRYITVPADADSILAVGGIDLERKIAPFSSLGPSADKRIKPDVVAHAQNIPIINTDGGIRNGNGTSFASPLIASLGACLWQAYPKATAMQVREAILRSADQYSAPDSTSGYGLPNGRKAFAYLQTITNRNPIIGETTFQLNPNPARDYLTLTARNTDSSASWKLTLTDLTGRKVFEKTLNPQKADWEYYLWAEDLNTCEGVYLLTLQNERDAKSLFRTKIIWLE